MGLEMKMMELSFVIGLFIAVGVVGLDLNSGGAKCGQRQCLATEYCSPFDTQCRPCSIICDSSHYNHDSLLCGKDCQQYLHDQRYVLRADLDRDGNLREEVARLSTLVKVSFALTIFLTLVLVFLLIKTFLKLKKIREALMKIFGKKWVKKNTNNDNVRNDVETGGGTVKSQQQNNARLIMPTISGRVAPSSQSSNECSTTNTSSTTLSRREATEDNTLDFAYDNPAMTPSPDTTVQLKSKRESSF